ncbi:MAG: recombination protein RecR [Bacteroidia bacterium]|nr:recombination protein RecR [Bacteroidia bacterium]
MHTELPKILEDVVNAFTRLPGIGRRTALRMALAQLKKSREETRLMAQALLTLAEQVKFCRICRNISDHEICSICSHPKRDRTLICIVEDIRDIIAIENTGQYNGLYHVLGGIISPVEGISPSQLNIESLLQRLQDNEATEIIMALNATMEGDTTVFYLYRKLQAFNIKISTIARGVSVGSELENADETTLGRSIINRLPYENVFKK